MAIHDHIKDNLSIPVIGSPLFLVFMLVTDLMDILESHLDQQWQQQGLTELR